MSRDGKIPHTATHLQLLGSLTSRATLSNQVQANTITQIRASEETVVAVDPSASEIDTVPTIQQALDELATRSGEVGVVTIADGESITLGNLDFTGAQRAFRRVVVRGLGRAVAVTDTVASVADYTTGKATKGWMHPVMTTAMTATAFDSKILYNETIGEYFGIKTNTTTNIEACAPQIGNNTSTGYYPMHRYGDDPLVQPFTVADTLVVFDPTSILTCSTEVYLAQTNGGEVEFEELAIAFPTACNIRSGGRVVFRGCTIDRTGHTLYTAGPISCPATIEGCVFPTAALGIFGQELGNEQERRVVSRSVILGGNLGTDAAVAHPPNVIMTGCYANDASIDDYDSEAFQADRSFVIDRCVFVNTYMLVRDTGPRNLIIHGLSASGVFSLSFWGGQVWMSQCSLSSTSTGEQTLGLSNCRAFLYKTDISGANTNVNTGVMHVQNNATATLEKVVVDGGSAGAVGILIIGNSSVHLQSIENAINDCTNTGILVNRGSKFVSVALGGAIGTGNAVGITLSGNSHAFFSSEPNATFSTVAADNIKVGDNANTTFAALNGGAAAVVNDFGTASPQMCSATIGP